MNRRKLINELRYADRVISNAPVGPTVTFTIAGQKHAVTLDDLPERWPPWPKLGRVQRWFMIQMYEMGMINATRQLAQVNEMSTLRRLVEKQLAVESTNSIGDTLFNLTEFGMHIVGSWQEYRR